VRVADLAALRYCLTVKALPSCIGGKCTSTHIYIVKIAVTVLELFRFCESQYFHFIQDIRVVYLLRRTPMNMCVPFSLPKTPASKVQKRKILFGI
jgi:hypothetical protein